MTLKIVEPLNILLNFKLPASFINCENIIYENLFPFPHTHRSEMNGEK